MCLIVNLFVFIQRPAYATSYIPQQIDFDCKEYTKLNNEKSSLAEKKIEMPYEVNMAASTGSFLICRGIPADLIASLSFEYCKANQQKHLGNAFEFIADRLHYSAENYRFRKTSYTPSTIQVEIVMKIIEEDPFLGMEKDCF